GSTAPPLPR
nr:Chain B, PL (PPLP) motif peptide from Myosin tail region-interacting protein MTI1 [Saccharomyces cerevisiae]